MLSLGKILVLLAAWWVMGAVIFTTTCLVYLFKVTQLKSYDKNGIVTEFCNMTPQKISWMEEKDTRKDVIRKVETITGEPYGIGWAKMFFVWPNTMALAQPMMQEAYEIMKEKYASKSKESAT